MEQTVVYAAAGGVIAFYELGRRRADYLPPNAFRSGDGLVTLEPGESHTAAWGLSPTIEVRE